MQRIGLLTVTHDPTGRNIKLFRELQKELESIYSEIFITVSEESSPELISVLKNSKFRVKIIPKKGAANARREVVAFGLASPCDYYHYCDFDRLLTWAKYHLKELRGLILDSTNHHYLILGRTERAMLTHPIEWIETEKISNKIFSLEFGQEVDITAGSCTFSKKSAEFIHLHSKERMTDAEWPMIIYRLAKLQVDFQAVEGLEYHEEINSISSTISEAEKWLGRLRLSLIISETAVNTGKQ
ncbi:hypothetical protein IM538_13920 [Cytobacillus suaedae]|nr:hypothetical protein IM538_13920 [Cytobacillus suaedae]